MLWSHLYRLLRIRVLVSSLLGAFGLLALSGGVASLPALASSPTASTVAVTKSGAEINSAPSWLTTAMPYVHVVNYVATIDPRLARVLNVSDLATVRASVSRYNATPIAIRVNGVSVSFTAAKSSTATSAYYSACYGYMRVARWNWWGVTFYLNDCFAQDLGLGLAVATVASGLLLLVPGLDVAVVALMAMLGAASGSILWSDHHCGNNGAYLNVPWVPAFVWGSTIC
jgi:hypothetical protein